MKIYKCSFRSSPREVGDERMDDLTPSHRCGGSRPPRMIGWDDSDVKTETAPFIT
jgi:hypothetical protein